MDEPRSHARVWVVYLLLFGAAIPWYLPASAATTTLLGLPLWVTISLACTLAIAIFTVFVISRYWHDDDEDPR